MSSEALIAASRFAELAGDFSSWCEGDCATGRALESEAAQWLARLHAEALALPQVDVENSDGPPSIPELHAARAKRNFRPFDGYYYREFFNPDPLQNDEPVLGDLGDDMLDIYKDIKRGLLVYEQGKQIEAIWHWSFLHRAHWGKHATSAMYALQCKAMNNS
ncbi:MAG TPA: DUF5063 domain-containing protein [Usitatibacteraceae bacterium]